MLTENVKVLEPLFGHVFALHNLTFLCLGLDLLRGRRNLCALVDSQRVRRVRGACGIAYT